MHCNVNRQKKWESGESQSNHDNAPANSAQTFFHSLKLLKAKYMMMWTPLNKCNNAAVSNIKN
jgi:hypothetical protein